MSGIPPSKLFPGVALVTGAASGIGQAVATSFAAEGCPRIVLLDRDEDGLSETMKLCKQQQSAVRTFVIPFDVRSESEVQMAVESVVEEWERIDYAVNCAGIFTREASSHILAPAEFDHINNVNYRGAWLCARAEIAQMIKQTPLPTHDGRPGGRGAIVNIASNAGLLSRPDTPAYNAAHAAVVSITKSDAIDYSPQNIRVNCVCPGVIDTPMSSAMAEDDPIVMKAPMARKGTAQEVADAALFLSSSKASFIQGAVLTVDGGYTIL